MKTVAFHNLGCKVNSYELDIMQQILQKRGYEIVPFDQMADIYIVNTCTVTNIADRKSRQMLHRAKQKNPEAVVVAVGCYVQTDLEGVQKDEFVDLAIGNNRKKNVAEILEKFLEERELSMNGADGNKAAGIVDKTLGGSSVIDINSTGEYEEMTLTQTAEHTRAYIKIQDGCNQFCSYCAIPLARGRVRSRRAEDILEEVKGIVAAGYKEIVLTGIHISSYGIDLEEEAWSRGESLVAQKEGKQQAEGVLSSAAVDYRGSSKLLDLVEKIHQVEGLLRIRLGSLEPRIVTEEAAKKLASLPKICPHFHLSLQSGCDDTLKRMNRHYTAEQYLESVRALRNAYAPAQPAVTTDVIVGFPGETEEEFAASKAFLEEVDFYEMHIFKYSKRAGTRAAVMPDQVPEPVKAERSDILLELEAKQSDRFRRKYLNQTVQVLLEEEKEIGGRSYLLGHTVDYVKVAVAAEKAPAEEMAAKEGQIGSRKPNDMVMLKVQEFLTEDILLGYETDLF